MQALIAVTGILVTLLVVAGMILIAPSGAEQDAVREDPPAVPAAVPVPLAGDAAA
jgi:hypothetical protein